MLTPDLTYAYRQPKDVSGPTFEVMSRQGDESDTATGVTFTLTGLPKDRMLVLSNVCILMIPGATQSVTALSVSATTPAGLVFDISRFNQAAATGSRSHNWQGEVFLLGGGRGANLLTITATFDAGANSNRLIASIFGVVIPRANAGPF